MKVEQRQSAAFPWTKPAIVGRESAYRLPMLSTVTAAI